VHLEGLKQGSLGTAGKGRLLPAGSGAPTAGSLLPWELAAADGGSGDSPSRPVLHSTLPRAPGPADAAGLRFFSRTPVSREMLHTIAALSCSRVAPAPSPRTPGTRPGRARADHGLAAGKSTILKGRSVKV